MNVYLYGLKEIDNDASVKTWIFGMQVCTFGVFNEAGNFAWNAPYISYDDIEGEDLSKQLEEYSKNNNRPY